MSEASEPNEFGDLPADWVVCNCSVCGALLSGRTMRPLLVGRTGSVPMKCPPVVAGSVAGRPVCAGCKEPRPEPREARSAIADDTDPGWENVVRALEGDG